MRMIILIILMLLTANASFAQTASSYDDASGSSVFGGKAPSSSNSVEPYGGLLDPARLSVSHSMSFMAGGSQMSDVKSQSIYSTMMQYKFNTPFVLSLNFDMPLHSTFNQYSNLSQDNLQSMDYFKNIPVEASLSWYPSEKFMMRFSVIKMPEYGSGYYGYNSRYSPWYRPMF